MSLSLGQDLAGFQVLRLQESVIHRKNITQPNWCGTCQVLT